MAESGLSGWEKIHVDVNIMSIRNTQHACWDSRIDVYVYNNNVFCKEG
jgi:hypothetical protein